MLSNQLDSMYREIILDHYKNPRGRKQLDHTDAEGVGHNPVCGDTVAIALRFENGKVADVSVNSRGCAISVASGSMLSELLPGRTLEEIKRITGAFREMMHGGEIPEELDIGDLDTLEGVKNFPVRIKCALLAWSTLKKLIDEWEKNPKQETVKLEHKEE